MKKNTQLIGLLFCLFLSLSINAQTTCEVENLFDPTSNFNIDAPFGQSFVACETGMLKSIPAPIITVGNTGASQAHNNMQPYLAINYIIALVGVFPSRS